MKKRIAFICQPEYFRFCYENDLCADYEVMEFKFHYGMREEEFVELKKFNAHYNVFFRGEYFPDTVLSALNGTKIAISSEPFPRKIDGRWEYTKDSVNRYLAFRVLRGKDFDYVFHYDEASDHLFSADAMTLSGSFVFPVATNTYKPAPQIKKKWDLFFIGRSTEHREKIFGPLKHVYNFLHIAHGIWGPELVEYINASKICINAHAEHEISWEPRMQMLMASGACVVSEKITQNKYLREGFDYIEFRDPGDAFSKVTHLLHNEADRDEISISARQTAEKYFSSQIAFGKLFENIENGVYTRFSSGNSRIGGVLRALGKIL